MNKSVYFFSQLITTICIKILNIFEMLLFLVWDTNGMENGNSVIISFSISIFLFIYHLKIRSYLFNFHFILSV